VAEFVSEFFEVTLKNVFSGDFGKSGVFVFVAFVETISVAPFAILFPDPYYNINFNHCFLILLSLLLFLNHKLKQTFRSSPRIRTSLTFKFTFGKNRMTQPLFFILELVRGFSCIIKGIDIVGLSPGLLLKVDLIIFFLFNILDYFLSSEIHFGDK